RVGAVAAGHTAAFHLLGVAGFLSPRDVYRTAAGRADRRAVCGAISPGRDRGAVLPGPSYHHLHALCRHDDDGALHWPRLDDRRDDSGRGDRPAAGIPRYPSTLPLSHRRRDVGAL